MREPLPPLLILTPVRNGAAFLPRYSRQEQPPDRGFREHHAEGFVQGQGGHHLAGLVHPSELRLRQEAVEPAAAFGHEFPGQDPGIRSHPAIIRPGRPVWTHRPPRLPSLTGSSRLKQCR